MTQIYSTQAATDLSGTLKKKKNPNLGVELGPQAKWYRDFKTQILKNLGQVMPPIGIRDKRLP